MTTTTLTASARSRAGAARVASSDVQTIVDTILKHARTGAVGDGKVFVMPVEEAYRVRTGESGEEVLQAHPGAAAGVAT